ncbi:MAG TPA: hypothetical protein DEB50_08255 [Desulfobacter sp.]|nr:hypothetical protein [Desulfobacter sp.]
MGNNPNYNGLGCGGIVWGERIFQTLKKGLDFHPNPLILFWRRLPDLNRAITALQAGALLFRKDFFLKKLYA